MAQDWETPPPPPTSWYVESPATAPQAPAAQTMRPLSLGEVLDRTFTVYRSRFWLFAGIGSISAAFQALIGAIQLIPMHLMNRTTAQTLPGGPASILPATMFAGMGVGMALVFLVVFFIYIFAFVITQATTVFALSEVYLGNWTTIGGSVQATIGKWYRYLGIAIWQGFVLAWIPTVLILGGVALLATRESGLSLLGGVLIFLGIVGGLPAGFILWLRNALAVQATVIERATVRASMRRSKILTSGAKGRIFVVLLLAGVLNYVAGLLQLPLLLFVSFTMARGGKAIGTEIAMLIVSFVAHAVVEPVAMIGLSLIYFDQRVRKEAFDLFMMLGPEPAVVAPAAFATPYVAAAMAEPAPLETAQPPLEGAMHSRTDDDILP